MKDVIFYAGGGFLHVPFVHLRWYMSIQDLFKGGLNTRAKQT